MPGLDPLRTGSAAPGKLAANSRPGPTIPPPGVPPAGARGQLSDQPRKISEFLQFFELAVCRVPMRTADHAVHGCSERQVFMTPPDRLLQSRELLSKK